MSLSRIQSCVYGAEGYCTPLRLRQHELDEVKEAITAQYLARLRAVAPAHEAAFAAAGLERYHTLAHLVDHKRTWPKLERMLPSETVSKIRGMEFFRELESLFGEVSISREEGIGGDEIYWRLVRPGQEEDVGPLHADSWFWELGHGVTPPGVDRIKLWIPVVCEPALNGLLVCPGSHLRDWNRSHEMRDGKRKPVMGSNPELPEAQMVVCEPGRIVVFHDRLVHRGSVNRGATSRVSIELTLFVSREVVAAWSAEPSGART